MSKSASGANKAVDSGLKVKTTGTSQLSGEIGRKYKLLVQILTSDPR